MLWSYEAIFDLSYEQNAIRLFSIIKMRAELIWAWLGPTLEQCSASFISIDIVKCISSVLKIPWMQRSKVEAQVSKQVSRQWSNLNNGQEKNKKKMVMKVKWQTYILLS